MKNIKNHRLYKVWNQVPINYYQKGVRSNFLQWLWHSHKIRLAKNILSKLEFKNCLDIGCASGYMVSQIANLFPLAKYTGIDIYNKAIKYARKTYPNIDFEIASADKLPFKNDAFDTILFYLPNTIQAFARSGLGMESRYYALSAIGVIGLLAYGFSFIKSKYINWILFLFLIFNLHVTNNLLLKYSTSRSIQIFNKICDKIDQDVPKGEIGSVFMYSGTDFSLRAALLDWKDTIPFAVRRGIVKKEEYPIMTNDKNLIARLVCEKNVLRHSPFGDLVQKDPIPLSYVHAWELKNGELENRSEQEKDGIKKIAKCLQKK